MTADFYEELAPVYDRMIPWERRLARERAWFEALWKRMGTRSVLDAACGSGGHLSLFVDQGLDVAGADASAAMLRLAAARAESLPAERRPRLVQAMWGDLPEKIAETFDAVLCLGNSLPYVTSREGLESSLAGLWSRVAPGGGLLIQFKNFERRREAEERFLPLTSAVDPADGTEYVVVREYGWHGDAVDFTVIVLRRPAGGEWSMRHHLTRLATWRAEDVEAPLHTLGARIERYGSLGFTPFERDSDEDVVIWAARDKA